MKKIKTLLALIMLLVTTGPIWGQITVSAPLTVNVISQSADEATITVVCVYSNGQQDAELRTIPIYRKVPGNYHGSGSTVFSIVTNSTNFYLTNIILVISTDDGEYTTLTYNNFVSNVSVDFRSKNGLN
ncbi:MAG: hypothetical protein LBP67_03020 [Bacteroidales bacterium]|jgi:hypothetical protein|nr:hypothetical protein [Bacteroidales bacterium]